MNLDGELVRTSEIEAPVAVEIREDPPGSFFLFRLDARGVCIADTWHRSVDEAKGQAEFEYRIPHDAWRETL